MDINYGDIIVLNSELKRKNIGVHSRLLQKEKYHRSFYRRGAVFFL